MVLFVIPFYIVCPCLRFALLEYVLPVKDFFTNPDQQTKRFIDLVLNIRNDFIKFLIKNRDNGDGGTGQFDLSKKPFDDIIEDEKERINMRIDLLNLSMPVAPASVPQMPTVPTSQLNTSRQREAIALKNP